MNSQALSAIDGWKRAPVPVGRFFATHTGTFAIAMSRSISPRAISGAG